MFYKSRDLHIKNTIEIIFIFGFLWIKGLLVNHSVFPWSDNFIIILSCLIDVILILIFVVKVDKEPISSIGIGAVSFFDILVGLALGLVLYLVQIVPPVIFLHMDISQFIEPPQWFPLFLRFLFLIATVGLSEELVFRGYLLHKLDGIVRYKSAAIFLNGLLFYILHLTKTFVFDWTQIYSTFATTIVLCIYLHHSKKKNLLPVIIAHALLDLLLGAPGFYLLNLVLQ